METKSPFATKAKEMSYTEYGIKSSMNSPRQCTDNAHMESSSIRSRVSGYMVSDLRGGNLKVAIKQYIEDFYNPVYLHSGIGYQSPMSLEAVG